MNEKAHTNISDYFKNPVNIGEIADADGIGKINNPICGDIMVLYIKVKNEIIIDAKFKIFGCGATIASGSMLTEMIKGNNIEKALRISNETITKAFGGQSKNKMHCAVLAEEALRAAINDYYKRRKLPSPIIEINPDNLHDVG